MRIQNVTFILGLLVLSACEPMEPPAQDMSSLSESCCGTAGLCVPPGLVSTELEQRLSSSECQEAWVCAPTEWVFGAALVPVTCRTPGNLEGRCLPSCMPELAEQASKLQQQTCDADYLCVPCFDPLTGEDTQACRIAPDQGPQESPEASSVRGHARALSAQ